MSRYVMVADLRRCVGCQTCTAACKVANGTPPWVEWRWVLDLETGQYPDVWRTFVPVGCQHCGEPPCLEVCPSGATYQRDDGIVGINPELCLGCAYCIVACPYQARYKVEEVDYAYGQPMESELAVRDPAHIGVATKCNFCSDRVDAGCRQGLVPGKDPAATPACVNACIATALYFGDLEDANSNLSRLLRENESFRMHEELGTDPGFYYLWDNQTGKSK